MVSESKNSREKRLHDELDRALCILCLESVHKGLPISDVLHLLTVAIASTFIVAGLNETEHRGVDLIIELTKELTDSISPRFRALVEKLAQRPVEEWRID